MGLERAGDPAREAPLAAPELREALLRALGDGQRIRRRRTGQDDRELVAAQAASDVGGTGRRRECLRKRLERLVAGRVTAEVVDPLQAVDVDDEQAELLAAPTSARDGDVEVLLEEPAVVEPGQAIASRQLLDLAKEPGVSNGGSDDVAERTAEVDVEWRRTRGRERR